ncbi:hypothetical protein EDD85DRAFT_945341 [Armillaria nabsnona]|nr:hypothetical protein EDD85DRAFT_945341 [Armillaria nabsnona]
MSIVAWIARRLRIPNNELPVNYKATIDMYKEINELANDRLKASYEKEISELRQEMKTIKDKAHEQERLQRKEHFEYLDIQNENVSLLYELAMLRETVSAETSLDVIYSIYRRRLEGPLSSDPQSVLSAIINGALDGPWHNYAYSRKKAISFVGPVLSEHAVDKAGHDLYNTCYSARLPPPPDKFLSQSGFDPSLKDRILRPLELFFDEAGILDDQVPSAVTSRIRFLFEEVQRHQIEHEDDAAWIIHLGVLCVVERVLGVLDSTLIVERRTPSRDFTHSTIWISSCQQ